MDVGLADAPPPPQVVADTSKIPCQRCGDLILPATAWRTLGYCMPCVREKDRPLPVDPIKAKASFSRVVDPTAAAPPTNFLSRYERGEREAVWQEMRAMGGAIGQGLAWNDVCQAVRRTMERVRHNIATIVDRLRSLGYEFSQPEAAYQPPTEQSLELLARLEVEFGSFPVSLRQFCETVGSVNLCQSIEQLQQGVFEKQSRAKIPSLHLLGEESPLYVADTETLLRLSRRVSQARDGRRYLWIAPDECARAHYSNGDDCHFLLPDPGVDFRWVEMRDEDLPHDQWLWFVDMLRQAFRGGGFQGRSNPDDGWRRSPPDNELTRVLAEGLLPI